MRIIISIIIVVFSLPSFAQNTLSNSMYLEAQFNLFLPYVGLKYEFKENQFVNLALGGGKHGFGIQDEGLSLKPDHGLSFSYGRKMGLLYTEGGIKTTRKHTPSLTVVPYLGAFVGKNFLVGIEANPNHFQESDLEFVVYPQLRYRWAFSRLSKDRVRLKLEDRKWFFESEIPLNIDARIYEKGIIIPIAGIPSLGLKHKIDKNAYASFGFNFRLGLPLFGNDNFEKAIGYAELGPYFAYSKEYNKLMLESGLKMTRLYFPNEFLEHSLLTPYFGLNYGNKMRIGAQISYFIDDDNYVKGLTLVPAIRFKL